MVSRDRQGTRRRLPKVSTVPPPTLTQKAEGFGAFNFKLMHAQNLHVCSTAIMRLGPCSYQRIGQRKWRGKAALGVDLRLAGGRKAVRWECGAPCKAGVLCL